MILDLIVNQRFATKITGGNPANPAYWVQKLFGGWSDTTAGVSVNEERAQGLSAFFCGVSLISNWIKVLPLQVFRRVDDGNKELATSHPAYRLLHRAPNPDTTPSRWKWFNQYCRLVWGNGFSEIERDGSGRPVALWQIHPSRVVMHKNKRREVFYAVYGNAAEPDATIPARNMIHTYDYSQDGEWGTSVVKMAAQSLGLSIATEQSAASFFGNGAQVSGAIKFPKEYTVSQDEKDEMRRRWREAHGGSGNAHQIAIFAGGGEWQNIGIPPEDAQLLETRTFNINEIARWLWIPPHKLKELSKATFSNISEQRLETVDEAVLPRAVELEEECDRKLLSGASSASLFCEFNLNAALRADAVKRSEYYKNLWGIGGTTHNRIFALENENGIGPIGDKHWVPLNMRAIEDPLPEPKPALPPSRENKDEEDENGLNSVDEEAVETEARDARVRESFRIVLRDAAGRAIHREADRIRRALKKYSEDKAGLGDWFDTFYKSHRAYVRQAVAPAIESYAHVRHAAVDIDTVVDSVISTSRGQMKGLLRDSNGSLEAVISTRLEEWCRERPDAIAARCLEN